MIAYGAGLQVWLGNGDGTFRAGQTISMDATDLTLADMNGDGILDIVVGCRFSCNGVDVLLGNGDGTFTAPSYYLSGDSVYNVVVGDFNGDGKPDIAAADGSNNTVAILLGNGDGTFQSPAEVSTGNLPTFVAAADLVGNGILDLVVTNAKDDTVGILLGNGDGTFHSQTTYSVGSQALYWGSVGIGDVNGDGKPDLLVANVGDSTISELLGKGDGTFAMATIIPVANGASSVMLGDLNSEGKLDVVVSPNASTGIAILYGNGDGSFQPEMVYPTGPGPVKSQITDLNADGKPDIVVVNYSENYATSDSTLSILLNQVKQKATLTNAIVNGTGTHPVSSAYSGDTNYAPSNSNTLDLAAGEAATIPVCFPAPGTYLSSQSVTISDSTPNATIHYTTDGSTPTSDSTVYRGAIRLTTTTTIKAVATASDNNNSPIVTATYTIETATPIAIFGTGHLAGSLKLAPLGSVDKNYTLISFPAGWSYTNDTYVAQTNQYPFGCCWLSNTSSAQWIGPDIGGNENQSDAIGQYDFRETFDLSSYVLSTVVLSGSYATDNEGYIQLNGKTVGPPTSTYTSLTPFTLTSGFVQGLNSIDFYVTNDCCGEENPSGLFVELSGAGVKVNIPTESVEWTVKSPIVYGTSLAGELNATLTANGITIPAACTYVNGNMPLSNATVLPAGVYKLTTTCVPSDTTHYSAQSGIAALTVDAAPLSVTASSYTIAFGAPVPSPLGYSVTSVPGFVNGDSFSSLSALPVVQTTAGTNPEVGTYPTRFAYPTPTSPNYSINWVPGIITVTKPKENITWPITSPIIYGNSLASELDATVTVGNTPVPGTCSYKDGETVLSSASILPAGTYNLTATCVPSNTTDYSTQTATAILVVNPAPLTITANRYTLAYGAPVPTPLGYSVTSNPGFVNGDSLSSLSAPPVVATKAGTSASPGTGVAPLAETNS